MFTGHVVMLPCLYLLVNFIAVGFQLLVETVLYMFVYGMSGMVDLPVDWLSPLVLFMRRTSVGHADLVRPISGTGAEVAIANFSGWTYPLVWAAFALLLGVLAGKFAAEASTGLAGNLRDAMYENIQHYSFSNIDKFSTAGLVTRMTTDVTNLQNAFPVSYTHLRAHET